jgi:SWIM zinc finger
MCVISRTRSDNEEIPEEVVEIAGTTGNVYNVKVNNEPSCSCPDAAKGNQCKHIIYVGDFRFLFLFLHLTF